MLAFEVHYLSGRAYACDFQNRRRAEWPPHPSRFFSAMVAAFYESGLGDEERRALKWLEQQGPPQIHASDGRERIGVTSYVPANDSEWKYEKKLKANVPIDGNSFIPSGRKRQPRYFPSFRPESPLVYFIWPLIEPNQRVELQQHAPALNRVAERVTYLGNSASLVQVRLCESAPPPTLVPDEVGDIALRVAGPGRLKDLSESHERNQRPSGGLWATYIRTDSASPKTALEESIFDDFFVFRLRSQTGTGLPVEATLKLTDAVRRTLLDQKFAGDNPTDLLTGHGRHPHCAYIALPFVGSQYADGHIIGFAVVLPKGLGIDDRRAVLRVLAKFKEDPQLVIPDVGGWTAEYVADEPPLKTLNSQTWIKPSRVWHSATPMLFDYFPKKNKPGRAAREIITSSCQNIGLPPPAEAEISPYASLTGVEPAGKFLTRRRPEDAPRYATHITLVFDHKVGGPILLGAGRYFGLGLMRPVDEDYERGE